MVIFQKIKFWKKQLIHDFDSPKGKTRGYLLETDMSNIFLNITIHLQQSQKASL